MIRWYLAAVLLFACADGIVFGHPKLRPATVLYPISVIFLLATPMIAVRLRVNYELGTTLALLMLLVPLLLLAPLPGESYVDSSQALFVLILFTSICTGLMLSDALSFLRREDFDWAIGFTLAALTTFTIWEFAFENFLNIDVNKLIGWQRTGDTSALEIFQGYQFYRAFGLSDEPTIASFNLIALCLLRKARLSFPMRVAVLFSFLAYFSLLSVIILASIGLIFFIRTAKRRSLHYMAVLMVIGAIFAGSENTMVKKLSDIVDTARMHSYVSIITSDSECVLLGEYACGATPDTSLGLVAFSLQLFGILGTLILLAVVSMVMVLGAGKKKMANFRWVPVGLFFLANAVLHAPLAWMLLLIKWQR